MNAYIHFVSHSPCLHLVIWYCIVVGFPPYLTFVTFNNYSVNFNFAGDFVLVLLNNQSMIKIPVLLAFIFVVFVMTCYSSEPAGSALHLHFCRLRKAHPDPQLLLNGTPIPVVERTKFLGLIFDKKLLFVPHLTISEEQVLESPEPSTSGSQYLMGLR